MVGTNHSVTFDNPIKYRRYRIFPHLWATTARHYKFVHERYGSLTTDDEIDPRSGCADTIEEVIEKINRLEDR